MPNYEYVGLSTTLTVGTTIYRENLLKCEESVSLLDNCQKIDTEKDMETFPWSDPKTIGYFNLEEVLH